MATEVIKSGDSLNRTVLTATAVTNTKPARYLPKMSGTRVVGLLTK
jgi:hypothetical protein